MSRKLNVWFVTKMAIRLLAVMSWDPVALRQIDVLINQSIVTDRLQIWTAATKETRDCKGTCLKRFGDLT